MIKIYMAGITENDRSNMITNFYHAKNSKSLGSSSSPLFVQVVVSDPMTFMTEM